MNDSEPLSAPADLLEQVDALRRQVFILLLASIVVSGTVATYLYYQSHILKESVDGVRPQATQVIQAYKQVTANLNRQQLDTFVNQLNAYAITHPDFQPVLKKYGWAPPPAAAPVKK
jgi:hypothetical protein